ncbi:MAG: EscU/YscU/HrcU family type III secretion system export apparatus switch protein [Janthinobacterium lividum]
MSDDKELPASEKKLRRALDENEDQPSEEISGLASLLVLGAVFHVVLPAIGASLVPLLRLETLDLRHLDNLNATIIATLLPLIRLAEIAAVLLFATALFAGLTGNLINRRRPPSLKMPSLSFDPLSHAKQLFRPSALLATFKLWVMAVALIAVIGALAWSRLPLAAYGGRASPSSIASISASMGWAILPIVVGVAALSAVIDAVQKRMTFIADQRMDHEEIKKENKEDNGDPLIKAKRLELARD